MPKLEDVLTRADALAYELERERHRVRELEAAMRGWREHNECSPTPDGVYILVPARHLDELLIGAIQK